MSKEQKDEVECFWSWFAANENLLRQRNINDPIFEELDEKLYNLGVLSWEIGPDYEGRAALVLSPSRDLERLCTTRRLASEAPSINGWRVLHAKPTKKWNRQFAWSEREVFIDARDWRFILYKYKDGKIEIVFTGTQLDKFSGEEARRIANFVAESELGEELFITHIWGVDIEASPSVEENAASNAIEDLYAEVSKALS